MSKMKRLLVLLLSCLMFLTTATTSVSAGWHPTRLNEEEEIAVEPAEEETAFEFEEEEMSEAPVGEVGPAAEAPFYPAVKFDTVEVENTVVDVEAPEGALPEGTVLYVDPVTDEEVLGAIAEAAGTDEGIVAVDISFKFGDQEIEPATEIKVTISTKDDQINAEEEYQVVHVDDELNAEVLPVENVETTEDGVSFVNDQFSVYAVTKKELLEPVDISTILVSTLANGNTKAPTTIAASKTLDDNGDGTQKLSLSVTGSAETSETTTVSKSNVVLIIDLSGSMNNTITAQDIPYVYDASTYDSSQTYRGRVNGNWVTLSRNNAGQWTYRANRVTYTYNGTVYWNVDTRLEATKAAAYQLIDTLLANNKDQDNLRDIIEISLVKFANKTETPYDFWSGWTHYQGTYNGTEVLVSKSTNAATLKTAIKNMYADGGTNWEAALQTAKAEAARIDAADETTSVIFLTDGKPTLYGNDNGDGQEGDDNVQTSWGEAKDDARGIITSGYELYDIFAYGSGSDYLKSLTNYAYTGTGSYNSTSNMTYSDGTTTDDHFYDASDTQALLDAFKAIIDKINNNVGFAGVNVEDGVTLGVTSTSAVVDGNVNEDSFTYTVTDSMNREVYTVKISGGKATFTVNDQTYTDTSADTVVTKIDPDDSSTWITSTVFSVTVGEGENAVTYKMSPAQVDADTGLIDWDLAGLGILENGYTYTLSFDVWPNQESYDMMADLNNGVKTLSDIQQDVDADTWAQMQDAIVVTINGNSKTLSELTDAEKQQISDGTTKCSYAIYTNYKQEVSYYTADEKTDSEGNVNTTYTVQPTKYLQQPDAIALTSSTMNLRKIWDDDLDPRQLERLLYKNGKSTEYKVDLKVWKADTLAALDTLTAADGNDYYDLVTLGWNGTEYDWDAELDVAPGTMVTEDILTRMGLNPAKYQSVTYDGTKYYILESGHYYTVTEVNSDYHFDLVTIVYHPMLVNGELSNVTFKDDGSVENIVAMSTVDATNTLRGGINLNKVVLDPDGVEYPTNDEFEFTIVLKNNNPVFEGDDIPWYGVDIGGTGTYYYYHDEEGNYADEGEGNVPVVSGDKKTATYTLKINCTDAVRINNVPLGTTYTITEAAKDGFTLAEIVHKITLDDVTEDGESTKDLAKREITGEIIPNRANDITFKNKMNEFPAFYVYHSSDNTIEKIFANDQRVTRSIDDNGFTKLTFNIVNETKTGTLYGGYYKSYKGAVKKDKEINETAEEGKVTYTVTDGKYWGSDVTGTNGAKAYSYTYIKDENRAVWGTDYYDAAGTAMNPEALGVYYLKEVPKSYILPYTHYTYNKGDKLLRNMWYVSALDDLQYNGAGFFVETYDENGKKIATIVDTLTVTTATGGTSVKLTPKGLFGRKEKDDKGNVFGVEAGYLTYWDAEANGLIEVNKTTVFTPYWLTPDNIYVCGLKTRTVAVNNGKVGTDGLRITDADNTEHRYPVVAETTQEGD